jgi:hypothetical protein
MARSAALTSDRDRQSGVDMASIVSIVNVAFTMGR